jgi:hypothetical protein
LGQFLVVDAAGNVIAAGSTNDGTGSAFTMIKYILDEESENGPGIFFVIEL